MAPRYISLILRCWTSDEGQVRARLIDVRSGASQIVHDLDDLPGIVRQLVGEAGDACPRDKKRSP